MLQYGLRAAAITMGALLLIGALCAVPSDIRAASKKSFDINALTKEMRAPDFTLTDLKGQPFRLSDHRGKRPVLIIFSTTWCTFCIQEIPNFKSLHATYGKQGLEIVNIDIQESKEKVTRFATKHELPYRTLLDSDGAVSALYEVRGVPTVILVDKNGMIACRQCRNVETMLKSIFKKQ
ncbi:MAG: redoxin domain-containing protein [Deltaproteobacteria bacterium]|nr:redoxin domain-containing protein [Deltaproteobacteria bacterium]